MTWTYADPSTTNRDAVRLRCGDMDTSIQNLSDEDVAYFLAQQGLTPAAVPSTANNDKLDYAAADACDAIAAKLANRIASKSALGLSRAMSENIRHLREMATRLRSSSSAYRVTMLVGGVTLSENEDFDQDSTVVQPQFRIGQDDHPGVPGSLPNDGWAEGS